MADQRSTNFNIHDDANDKDNNNKNNNNHSGHVKEGVDNSPFATNGNACNDQRTESVSGSSSTLVPHHAHAHAHAHGRPSANIPDDRPKSEKRSAFVVVKGDSQRKSHVDLLAEVR